MQAGNADRSGKFENNRYKETGNLISICMPPCMGKTIAAVFLCLSAVSVKGFLSLSRLVSLLALRLNIVHHSCHSFCTEAHFFGKHKTMPGSHP